MHGVFLGSNGGQVSLEPDISLLISSVLACQGFLHMDNCYGSKLGVGSGFGQGLPPGQRQ